MADYHPELAGAHDDDDRPLRSRRARKAMRVIVIVGLIALVLPSILVTLSVAGSTASSTCEVLVDRELRDATASARFDLLGPAGPAWYCYASRYSGDEIIVASLGLIPGPPPPPANA